MEELLLVCTDSVDSTATREQLGDERDPQTTRRGGAGELGGQLRLGAGRGRR